MLAELADELVSTVLENLKKLEVMERDSVEEKAAFDKWSKKEVIGHLIDSAANNHQRFVKAQFTDKLVIPPYDQDAWVKVQGYRYSDWKLLIYLWKFYNFHLADVIANIPEEKAGTIICIGEKEPITLERLIKDYLWHLQYHIGKVVRQ